MTEVERSPDVPYSPRGRCDVYWTREADGPPRRRPCLLYVHGGGWHLGSRARTRTACEALARRGYVVFSADYGLSTVSRDQASEWVVLVAAACALAAAVAAQQGRAFARVAVAGLLLVAACCCMLARLPRESSGADQMRHVWDVARAVAFVHANGHQFGHGNPDRLVLVGHSAGAHLVTLVATNGRYLERYGLDPHAVVTAVCGLSGVYSDRHLLDDYRGGKALLRSAFGLGRDHRHCFPVYSASRRCPPLLLVNAEHDYGLGWQARDLCVSVRAAGGYCNMCVVPDSNHLTVHKQWDAERAWVADKIDRFLRACPTRPGHGPRVRRTPLRQTTTKTPPP